MRRLAWALAAPFLAWWGVWLVAVTVGAAVLGRRRPGTVAAGEDRLDVVVPAHNEAANLPALLASLGRPGETPGLGRVIVIADHCSDDTAAAAAGLGAEVLSRDTGTRGKPAALRDGLAWYRATPTDAVGVAIIDADCRCSPGYATAMVAGLRRAPIVQSANLVGDGDGDAAADGVAVGVGLRNLLRPAGLDRLGIPVMLSGTGMAVRADHVDRLAFGDHLTEDLVLSRELLLAGTPVGFVSDATVNSDAPPDRAALTAQRERWEGGSLAAGAGVPRVFARLAARRDWRGLVSLIDGAAPPLAPTAAAWGGLTVLAGLARLVTGRRSVLAPFLLAGTFLFAYLAIGIGALRGVGGLLRVAGSVPGFVGWKLGVYRGMGRGKGEWTATPRAASNTPGGER
ncbi:MAG: glycosyltransferase family 2 protein [Actinobacteria bacterium]|nr:glycosyltransferase family 2 protein [Thermoleophilia bacterium]MCB9010733.1 glycosyltransferase family 2 protein [Actinomycetota bacterium]